MWEGMQECGKRFTAIVNGLCNVVQVDNAMLILESLWNLNYGLDIGLDSTFMLQNYLQFCILAAVFMPQAPLPCCKYSYIHHDQKGLSQAIDIHDISIAKNRVRVLISYLGALLFLAGSFYLLLMKEKLDMHSIWSIFLVFVLANFLQYKPIKKESVVIMPGFAVQLETHYWSGRIARRFVPIDEILRPVLNECVTPVTCYWSLALILRGEEELMLVFKESQPPVKMLVPVWKALCVAIDCKARS